MTWFRLVYIVCDDAGCEANYLGQTHEAGMRDTRGAARELGWRVWEGHDFCPEHAAAGIPRARTRPLTDADPS